MPPSSLRARCQCPACLSVCQDGIWHPRATISGHLRRVQHEAQLPQPNLTQPNLPQPNLPEPVAPSTSEMPENQLLSLIPPEPPQASSSSSTPYAIPPPRQSRIHLLAEPMPDSIIPPATHEDDGDEDENIVNEGLGSRLFTLIIDDTGPDIDGHSRLWTSRTDFQAVSRSGHILPKLREPPLELLVAGTQRLISSSAEQASSVPQNASPPPGSSSVNSSSSTPPRHNRLHARYLQVLANIESRILQLRSELSQASGPEIPQIEAQLHVLRSQLEKVQLKSVVQIKDSLLDAMRPLFILCAAHPARGAEVTGPVPINSGET
jgi:hypothetical protein